VSEERVYNPLDKDHLAESIVREFFKLRLHPLPPADPFTGAGIYALYYKGDFLLYRNVAQSLWEFTDRVSQEQPTPIYIGKSDPPGSRKGIFEEGGDDGQEGEEEAREVLTTRPKHRKLFVRLRQHAASISATKNLRLKDFECRYMLVDEVWVPLGEARLVNWFRPLWNVLIEGFGSNVEGGGRSTTARPVWDILHPGRKESLGIRVAPEIEDRVVSDLRSASTLNALHAAIKAHRDAKLAFRKKPRE
jgi:hypothetical protein